MPDTTLPFPPDEVAAHLAEAVDLAPVEGTEDLLDAVGTTLTGAGLRSGEIVLISVSNGLPLLRCFYAVLFAGGVPALLAPGTPQTRIREIAEKLGSRRLISMGRTATGPGRRWSIGPLHLITLDIDQPVQYHHPGEVILLTSGTSGVASGCLHRWPALLRNAGRHAASVGLRSTDTMLVNLPLNFSYALVAQAMAGLATGARLVLTGPPFTPPAYVAALRDHRISSSSLTPFMVRSLIGGGWEPPPPLRMVTVGGESLEPLLAGRLLDAGSKLELYLTYGLTEAGPRVSTLAAHQEPDRLASVGKPIPGVQVSLRDTGPDGTGELLVSSDTVLRQKVGVEEGRVGSCLVGPDQIATGDLFRLDPDGNLYFRGRLSDFIVTGGTKVSLASIRRIANSLPNVVTSATRAYRIGDCTRFDLDLYLQDTGTDAADKIQRSLRQRLLRAEWPNRIRTLPVRSMGHK